MKNRNEMAVILLLTLITVMAFVTPASANGYISGTVLDTNEISIAGVNVTATNGTDVFYYVTSSTGDFVITIPAAFTPKDYYVEASKVGYYDSQVQLLSVSDGYTTIAQIIVMQQSPANELNVVILPPHKLVSDGMQGLEYSVSAALLKDSNPFAIANEDVTLTIDDPTLAKFKANDGTSITVKTDVSGIATTSIVTSTANTGVVTVTGTYTTIDNVLLTDWDSLNVRAGGEISGVVTNEFNVYLPDANVKLYEYNPVTSQYDIYPVQNLLGNNIVDKPTNDIGVYTFTQVPSGQYMVRAFYGPLSGYAAPVVVTTGITTANIVIVGAVVDTEISEISGVVTNEYNVILPDANVKLNGYNPLTSQYDIYPVQNLLGLNIADEQTNEAGIYTFTQVPSGQYMVRAFYSTFYGSLNGFEYPVVVTTGTTIANIVIEGALVDPVSAPSVYHQYSWYADYDADSSITRNDGLVIGVLVNDADGLTDISSVTVDASQLGLSSSLSLVKNPGGGWDDSHYMEALDLTALNVIANSGTVVLPVTVTDSTGLTDTTGTITVTIQENIAPEVIHTVSWGDTYGTIFVAVPWDIGASHIASVKLDASQIGLWDDLEMTYDAGWDAYVLYVTPSSSDDFRNLAAGTYYLNVDITDTSGYTGTGTLEYTK